MIHAMSAWLFVIVLVPAAPPGFSAEQKGFDQIARHADAVRLARRIQYAIRMYRQGAGLRPASPDGWWWLGSLYDEEARFPEAQAALVRFLTLAPKPRPAYAFLGCCEYETHDYAYSLERFRKELGSQL
jgi:tetratricopeptide (TPR) repeat protein